jgi:exosortase
MCTVAPDARRTLSFLWLGGIAVALGVLFAPTFLALWKVWDKDPNYSHGYFVLPISLFLAYLAIRDKGWPVEGNMVLGSLYLAAGIPVHLAAVVVSWPLLDFAALALLLRGVAVAVGGREWARSLTFPILFLFFMFPLPPVWIAQVALTLQEWVSAASYTVLDLFTVVYRKGTSLHLAGINQPLVVAEECSGLRQLVAFVALAALIGYLLERPLVYRLLLLVVAFPVAVLANIVRVLLMAAGAKWFGTGWMDGPLHHAPFLVSLPVGLALFLLADCGLARLWRLKAAPKEAA